MDDVDENAHLVNALQRHASVVVQKSLVEGFGLTVTEAMWKARPVVASAVGGIQDQIVDGSTGCCSRTHGSRRLRQRLESDSSMTPTWQPSWARRHTLRSMNTSSATDIWRRTPTCFGHCQMVSHRMIDQSGLRTISARDRRVGESDRSGPLGRAFPYFFFFPSLRALRW